jgi:hypothetical protein
MTDSPNAQSFFLSYTARITGSLGFGVLQANPALSVVWVNFGSPKGAGFSGSVRGLTQMLGIFRASSRRGRADYMRHGCAVIDL